MEAITQESLTQADWGIFEKWYRQVKLSLDEEQARHNVNLILSNLKNLNYTVTAENLTRVLQRLFTLPRTTIYVQPEAGPSDARSTQHQNKQFTKLDQVSLTTDQKSGGPDLYVNGRLNHARTAKPHTAPAPALSQSDETWQRMADSLRANTHSKTAELLKIVGSSPRQTFELRKKRLDELSRS
jgi:hypothetical protein